MEPLGIVEDILTDLERIHISIPATFLVESVNLKKLVLHIQMTREKFGPAIMQLQSLWD